MSQSNIPEPPSYRDEFKQSINLFEQSLQEYQKADGANVQQKFKEVMDKTALIMNEAAPQFLSSAGKEHLQQLQVDFKSFSQHPSSDLMQKLQNDINSLKGDV